MKTILTLCILMIGFISLSQSNYTYNNQIICEYPEGDGELDSLMNGCYSEAAEIKIVIHDGKIIIQVDNQTFLFLIADTKQSDDDTVYYCEEGWTLFLDTKSDSFGCTLQDPTLGIIWMAMFTNQHGK